MADNTILPGAGDIIADEDVSGVKYQRMKLVDSTVGSTTGTGTPTNPFSIQPAASYFVAGTGNTSVAQLASGASFTGTIENTLSQPAVSLLINSDQNLILTIYQYIDAAGAFPIASWSYPIIGGTDFAQSFTLNANYFNLVVTNTSGFSTVSLNINTYYGTIAAAGITPPQGAMPVTLASLYTPISVTSNSNITIMNAGYGTLGIQLTNVPAGATVSFRGCNTGNLADYVPLPTVNKSTNVIVTSTTAAGGFWATIAGVQFIQLQITGAWTGTVTGAAYGTESANSVELATGTGQQPMANSYPVTLASDNTVNVYDDSTALLRRIVKILENQQATDQQQRQRVTIDNIASSLTLGTVSAVTGITNALPAGTNAIGAITQVAGYNHMQFIDISRDAYANCIRNKLTFA